MKHCVLLAIQAKLKLAKFYYLSVSDLWQNPSNRVARVGKLLSSETLQNPHMSSWFFIMLCKSYGSSTYVNFRVE